MTSIIANGGNDTPSYPTVSVGVHKARCVRVIDLGTQQNDYQGQISWKRQVMLIWEVPSETDNKGGVSTAKSVEHTEISLLLAF